MWPASLADPAIRGPDHHSKLNVPRISTMIIDHWQTILGLLNNISVDRLQHLCIGGQDMGQASKVNLAHGLPDQ